MTTTRVEAETLTLTGGYIIELKNFASGGQYIGISGVPGTTGTATTAFTPVSGTYNVIVGYYDEMDGNAELSLAIGGNTLGSWVANQYLSSDTRASVNNFTTKTFENVSITNNSEIKLIGTSENGDNARVDYIEFVPVDNNTPPTDIIAPTASGTANDFTVTNGNSDSYTFTVTYSDNQAVKVSSLDSNDIRVTGPNNFSQLATFVDVNVDSDGTPRTATYRINAPGGSWDTNEAGTYTVAVQSSQINDTSNNTVAAANLDTFKVTVNPPPDTTAPTATGTANDLTVTSGNSDSYTFTVTYSDNQAVKVSSLDSNDIRVIGPNNFSQLATFVSVDVNSDGTPRTATYRINAPGGSWDTNEAGTYTVAVQSSQINDTSNNTVAAANLDTFKVTVNPPTETTPTETVRLEAETLSLSDGYRLESGTFASGSQYIGLSSSLGMTGTATKAFTGTSGQYDVTVGYYDESDGAAQLSLAIGGTSLDQWVANQYLSADTRASANNFVKRTIKNVSVTNNTEIKLTGTIHEGDNARVDYIEFVPVSSSPSPTDTTAPTANLKANSFNTTSGSTNSYTFQVTYSDNVGINVSSLNSNDIRVTGPNNFNQLATFVSVDTNSNGTPRTATYRINSPGGSWDANEAGTYNVSVESNQVSDTSNNNVTSGNLGNFQVSVSTVGNAENTADYSQESKGIHANLEQKVGYIPDHNQTLKIMPLGDSITQGKIDNNQAESDREGYRIGLWKRLDALGVPIDFVGSQWNGTSNLPDKNHQGHSGWRINNLKDGRWDGTSISGGVDTWIPAANPDVVLLMIGTNDADDSGNIMADRLSGLIDKITANNSFTGDLIVSTIAPIHKDSFYYSKRMPNVQDYNSRIPGIVDSKPATENVRFVNMWEGPNRILETDMSSPAVDNGLHPTAAGYEKMADYWFNSVLEATGQKKDLSNKTNVKGSDYQDVIVGNSSSNRIEGGAGNDKLTGQGAADTFIYNNPSHGNDTLTDFNPNEGDVFEISASGFGAGLVAGTALSTIASDTGVFVDSTNFNYLGSMAHFFYNSSTGVLSFDRDGNQAQTPITLATLTTKPSLGVNDFLIV